MFTSDLKAKTENLVKIEDVNADNFEAVLFSVHAGFVKDFEDNSSVIDWLIVVDRFNFWALRAELEKGLFARISTENAVEILSVTNRFAGLEDLKEETLNIICSNWQNKFLLEDDIENTISPNGYKTMAKRLPSSPRKRSRR